MEKRAAKTGETTEQYLKAALAYCRRRFDKIREDDGYRSHESHAVAQALGETEQRFTDLNTFGAEGDCASNGEDHVTIQYLNTGDTYDLTIIYRKGRFILSSFGNILESAKR